MSPAAVAEVLQAWVSRRAFDPKRVVVGARACGEAMTSHPKFGPQGLLQGQVVFSPELPLDGQPHHLSLMQEQPQGGRDHQKPK
jgi:hypothetical protein